MKINLNAFVLVCLFVFCKDVTCVVSVSVRFRTKERGTTVKDHAKNGVIKIAGREWG